MAAEQATNKQLSDLLTKPDSSLKLQKMEIYLNLKFYCEVSIKKCNHMLQRHIFSQFSEISIPYHILVLEPPVS